MYILILLLPFLGFILSGAFGRYFGRLGSAFISTFIYFYHDYYLFLFFMK